MLTLRTGGFFTSRTHFPTSVSVAAKLGPARYGGSERSTVVLSSNFAFLVILLTVHKITLFSTQVQLHGSYTALLGCFFHL